MLSWLLLLQIPRSGRSKRPERCEEGRLRIYYRYISHSCLNQDLQDLRISRIGAAGVNVRLRVAKPGLEVNLRFTSL